MKRFSPAVHPVEFHRDWKLTVDARSGEITLAGKVTTVRPYRCVACKGNVTLGGTVVPVLFTGSRLQGLAAHTYLVTCAGKGGPRGSCPAKAQIHLEFTISDGSHRLLERLVDVQESAVP